MRIFQNYKIAALTVVIVALSIYIKIYGGIYAHHYIGGIVVRFRFFQLPPTQTETKSSRLTLVDDHFPELFMSIFEDSDDRSVSLQYDYYREFCPSAERIIRRVVKQVYSARPTVAPSLIRLLFHDCFVEGCDASVLLDADGVFESEKDFPPNRSLKGFDVIDKIKEELENVCPRIVSCTDILVLAAREAVLAAGGPFYPLYTGRKDSLMPYAESAAEDIPSPEASLSETLHNFASKGFNERETVSLLGAHSIGVSHCHFFVNRLYNFSGTDKPDPSLDPFLLQELKTKCSQGGSSPSTCTASAPAPAPMSSSSLRLRLNNMTDPFVSMTSGEETEADAVVKTFGTRYYRGLLQNRGLLYTDQQLMTSDETATWVKAYAYSPSMFYRDFALSMMKLSNLNVLTGSLGQVRRNCSKVAE